jgi:hypothetical protein
VLRAETDSLQKFKYSLIECLSGGLVVHPKWATDNVTN